MRESVVQAPQEEQRGGMFSKAKEAELDLKELGLEMYERKQELMKQHKARQ